MRHAEIEHSRVSALRKRITFLNKALKGAKSHPNGMSRLVAEDAEREKALIQAELVRRNNCCK